MTRLEQRVYDVFSQKDLFVTLDSAMQYFTGMSRTQVENALESLCQQGKLYSTDTFVGRMYGYDSTEYCLADNALDVNMSTREGMESVIEALQNNDAVMIRATDLLPDFDEKIDQIQNLASVLSKIAYKSTETETPATKTGTLFDWTFNSGLRVGENKWDIAIPDGFVKVGSSSRRFELIPADARYRYSDDRPVEILPTANVSGQDDSGLDLDNWFYHPLANKARGLLVSTIASKPQKINLNLSINGGEKRNISSFDTGVIPTKDIFGIPSKELVIGAVVQDIMGTNNFLINFYSDTQHKQIRVRTDHISETHYKQIKQSIIRWASTFRFSKINKKIPSLLIDSPKCIEELARGEMTTTVEALEIIARDVAAPGNVVADIGSDYLNILGEEKAKTMIRGQLKDAIATREFYIPKVEKLFERIRDILTAHKMLKLHKAYSGLSLPYLEVYIGDVIIREYLSAEAKEIVEKWKEEIKQLEDKAEDAYISLGTPWKKNNKIEKSITFRVTGYSHDQRMKMAKDATAKFDQIDLKKEANELRDIVVSGKTLSSEKLIADLDKWITMFHKNLDLALERYLEAEKASAILDEVTHMFGFNTTMNNRQKYMDNMVSYITKRITKLIELMAELSEKYENDDCLIDIYNTIIKVCQKNIFKVSINGQITQSEVKNIDDLARQLQTDAVVALMNRTPEEKTARLERKKEKLYLEACAEAEKLTDIAALKKAEKQFGELGDYKDSAEKMTDCRTRIDIIKKEESYLQAIELSKSSDNKEALQKAGRKFSVLKDYKDSRERYARVSELLNRIEQREKDYSDYKKAIADYEKAVSARICEINTLVEEKIVELTAKEKEKLTADYKKAVHEKESKKSRLLAAKISAENTLSSLGLFKGKEKKQCRADIERLSAEIKQMAEDIYNLRIDYENNIATAVDKITAKNSQIKMKISQQLPQIVKPALPESLKGYYRPL